MAHPNISVNMVRESLDDIPRHTAPEGFSIRGYQPGDEQLWVEIESSADTFNTIGLDVFRRQFGADAEKLAARQFYLLNARGVAVGTASAWHGDEAWGREWGRVHWVAIVPSMQGKGLSKPLLSAVCEKLKSLGHERAYLVTSSARIAAIRLYTQFGFVPDIRTAEDRKVWDNLNVRNGP